MPRSRRIGGRRTCSVPLAGQRPNAGASSSRTASMSWPPSPIAKTRLTKSSPRRTSPSGHGAWLSLSPALATASAMSGRNAARGTCTQPSIGCPRRSKCPFAWPTAHGCGERSKLGSSAPSCGGVSSARTVVCASSGARVKGPRRPGIAWRRWPPTCRSTSPSTLRTHRRIRGVGRIRPAPCRRSLCWSGSLS